MLDCVILFFFTENSEPRDGGNKPFSQKECEEIAEFFKTFIVTKKTPPLVTCREFLADKPGIGLVNKFRTR